VARRQLGDQLALEIVERGKQGQRAMAHVIMGLGADMRQRPCGTLATSQAPRAQRPWRRVMLSCPSFVRNTRRRGSNRP
jgi:hypothetical protein